MYRQCDKCVINIVFTNFSVANIYIYIYIYILDIENLHEIKNINYDVAS